MNAKFPNYTHAFRLKIIRNKYMTKRSKFIIAVAAQVALILGIIIFKFSILAGGTEVVLRIRPVDPRDWLRGDYVTFQYDVSSAPSYYSAENIKVGDSVYVILVKSGKYWMLANVQKDLPEKGIFIKGTVVSGGYLVGEYEKAPYQIAYGVEQFFIPEGAGSSFSFWGKEAYAVVKVDNKGSAVLSQIFVEGKPWPAGREKLTKAADLPVIVPIVEVAPTSTPTDVTLPVVTSTANDLFLKTEMPNVSSTTSTARIESVATTSVAYD